MKIHCKYVSTIVAPIVLLLNLMHPSGLSAQSSTNYSIEKSVLDQAGSVSSSTNYQITDAIGQPGPVGASASAEYSERSGFLAGGVSSTGIKGEKNPSIPVEFELLQNYPNPFNPETSIEYRLPAPAEVVMKIYDIRAHEIRTLVHGMMEAGCFMTFWDGRDESGRIAPSGVYICRIVTTGSADNKRGSRIIKLMLLK